MSVRGTPRGSDENLQYSAASDSFWDVGNFKRTVKRIDDGAKLCDEFMKLVTERAEIEAKYAFKLKAWSKKWEECIRSGPEYGSMEAAMRGTVTEAESRAGIHTLCRDKLMDEVHEAIKKWKNENYHKGIFQWKETKEAEEGFTKAQKPWAKRLGKVERSKKAFHNASRNTEQAERLESEASNNDTDPKIADKLKKLQDATEKAKREREKCREKYELRLEEITGYNPQYERDMIQEFEKCQENEDKRLVFFRETLVQYHKCLDISESPEFSGIFVNMGLTFQKADAQADLDWWTRNHGTGMPPNWPMFEARKHPNQKLRKRIALFRKSPAEQTKLDVQPLAGMPSSEEPYNKLRMLHFDLEHDSLRKSETVDSDNLISFNTDECLGEGVLYYSIDSKTSCNARIDNIVNVGEQPRDRNFSAIADPVESIRSNSDKEVVYCEILDVSVGNQVASGYSSQEKKVFSQSSQSCHNCDGVLGFVKVESSRHTELGQEYNEFPQAKRTLSLRHHEQTSAVSSYPANQNHVDDNTDYSHQNEINPFNDFTTTTSEDFSGPSAKDEWDIEPPPIEDAGIPVRALYDFQGVEEDELNFKEGDVLTQLSSQDDQGWCQGRFQGRVGHFPGSYVEPL